MAVVVKNKNSLNTKYMICILVAILSLVAALGFGYKTVEQSNLKLLLGMIVCILISVGAFNYSKKIFSGLRGERQANKVYRRLSDDYYVFNNVRLEVDGKKSEIDNIVVGNNGIFVIEAKNYKGRIEFGPGEKKITQYKTGKNGGQYNKQHYSPINQVGTHVYRVSEYLKKNKVRTWVQGAVYFANDYCQVNINSEKTPVFSKSSNGDKKLIKYIQSYKNENSSISNDEKHRIVTVLKEIRG